MLGILLSSCDQASKTNVSNDPVMTTTTLQAKSIPISIFDYPGQVTDGRVLLSVEEINSKCHKINETFQIRFIFTNLTDSPIRISSDVSIAVNRRGDGGSLSPFITFEDGRDIYKIGDATLVDIFELPLDTHTQIPGNTSIDFAVKNTFPKLVVEYLEDETINYVTPVPGHYFVRFVYSIYHPDPDIWQEIISSDKLAICIED